MTACAQPHPLVPELVCARLAGHDGLHGFRPEHTTTSTDTKDTAMTPDEMLSYVHEYGEDAITDYHDGLDGWFGWTVRDNVLTSSRHS